MPFDQMTDEELAVLAKQSVEAESELISRYYRLIRFHAGRYATVTVDAEDLTQEGLITLLHAIQEFDVSLQKKFSSFAQVCIINQMRNLVRREGRSALPDDEFIQKMEENGKFIDVNTPESILLEKESYSQRCTEIQAVLSEKEWKILQSILNGASYAQTAEQLHISLKSVDNAMQRIRRKMRAVHKD